MLEQYRLKMRELCGDPAECKFPEYYFGNLRQWDYPTILKHTNFKSSDVVLEVGALHSYFCIYASQLVEKYVCTDSFYWYERGYAKPETHQSPKEWCEYITKKGKNVVGEEADLQNLKYPDESFDKVLCISVIEHVHDDHKGMSEMMRVLKPGGVLLLTTEYNPTWSKPYTEADHSYYRVYDKNGIDSLLDKYKVDVIEVDGIPEARQFTTLFAKVRK